MRTRIGSVMVSLVPFPAAGKRREKERRELISLNTTTFLSLLSYIFCQPDFSCKKSCGHWGPMIDSATNLAKSFPSELKFLRSLILQGWSLFSVSERRRTRHETGELISVRSRRPP